MNYKKNFYIITGGPGVGKTTLHDELGGRGYRYVPEVARDIIRQQIDTGGNALPWADTRKYSDLMLDRSVEDFLRLSVSDELYFFDRGIPDTYGYEKLIGLNMSEKLKEAVVIYRYNPIVFILPAWKEIYETDSERKQDFAEAVATYHVMTEIYSELGYTPIEVPLLPVKERADFVLSHLRI